MRPHSTASRFFAALFVLLFSNAVVARLPGRVEEGAIPFELKEHAILVKGRIDDSREAFNFIVDTGGKVFLDQGLAAGLDLKRNAFMVKMNSLTLHDFRIEEVSCPVLFDFNPFERTLGVRFHGMIGSDLLERFKVTFDYANRMLNLLPSPRPFDQSSEGHRLSFRNHPVNNAPMVRCTIQGLGEVEAMIDTGQPYGLVLPIALHEDHPDLCACSAVQSIGVIVEWPGTNRKDALLSRIGRFEMGGIITEAMPVLFAELPAPLSVPLIGKDFLSRFTLVINYPHDELLLIPREGVTVKDNERSFGLSPIMNERGGISVRGIWKGSPADLAGIQPGDEMVKVHGEEVSGARLSLVRSLLANDRVTSLQLELKNREGNRTVTLRKALLLAPVSAK